MVDIDKPRWDQNTYIGRMKYFFSTTNPINIFKSSRELDDAKKIIDDYRCGKINHNLSIDDVYHAKVIVDSAFHPDTGDKMFVLGRMSAQVPMNMLITGCMVAFYKTTQAVLFWQWFNQSFNALVNYTNRSGTSNIPVKQLTTAYVSATGGALITALAFNKIAKKSPPIFSRFVPFIAVAAANFINIPMMRSKELNDGIRITDERNNELGNSKKAASRAILTVILSRVCMCAPGMIFTPIIMNAMEKTSYMKRYPRISIPLQILLSGCFLSFSTPMACALFPQTYPIPISDLEPEIQENCEKFNPKPEIAYFNKGL